jgi:hypothetical protein
VATLSSTWLHCNIALLQPVATAVLIMSELQLVAPAIAFICGPPLTHLVHSSYCTLLSHAHRIEPSVVCSWRHPPTHLVRSSFMPSTLVK